MGIGFRQSATPVGTRVCDIRGSKRGQIRTLGVDAFGSPEDGDYVVWDGGPCPPRKTTTPAPALPPAQPAPPTVLGGEFSFSSYGAYMPVVYGSYVLSGNVFWHSGFTTKTFTQNGEKSIIYITNFALGLCEGQINDVLRIWIGPKLVYDKRIQVDENGVAQPDESGILARATINALSEDSPIKAQPTGVGETRITIFNGSEYQNPSAAMAAIEGFENTPGYRGTAFILFENFFTGDSSTPDIRVEVLANSNPVYAYVSGEATDTAVFTGALNRGIAYDPTFKVVYLGAEGFPGDFDEAGGFVSFDARTMEYVGDHKFFESVPGGAADTPETNYLFGVLADGNIITHDFIGNPGRLVTGSPWANVGLGELANTGVGTAHTVNGPTAVGKGSALWRYFDDDDVACNILGAVGRIGGSNCFGIATIYPGGQIVWRDFVSNALAQDVGGLSTETANVVVPLHIDYAVAQNFPTFADTVSTEGGHAYVFTIDDPDYLNLYIDRITYFDPLDDTVSLSNIRHDYVGSISLDYIGGTGRNHEIITAIVDPLDNGIVLFIRIAAGTPFESDRVIKYDPFSGGFYYNKPLPATLPTTPTTTGAKVFMGPDRLFGWASPSNKLLLTNLTSGDTTVVVEDTVDSGLGDISDVENLADSVWLGDEGALIFQVGDAYGAPQLRKVWLTRQARGTTFVSDVVKDLLRRAGWNNADTRVETELDSLAITGYAITSSKDVRNALAELKQVYGFDIIESDGTIVYKARGATPTTTIASELLGQDDEDGYLVETIDTDIARLRKLALTYLDIEREYEQGVQVTALPRLNNDPIEAANFIDVTVPVVLDPDTARQLSESLIYQKTVYERNFTFKLPTKYQTLDPGEVITVTDGTDSLVMRLLTVEIGDNKEVRVEAVAEDPDIYAEAATLFGASGRLREVLIPFEKPAILPILLPIPTPSYAFSNFTEEGDQYRVFFTMVSPRGATLDFDYYALFSDPLGDPTLTLTADGVPTWGYVTNPPNNTGALFSTDNDSTLTVKLVYTGQYTPTTAPAGETTLIENEGANLCIVGGELLKFTTATVNGDGTITLTGLHRALYGTDQAARSHTAGEYFFLIGSHTGVYPVPPVLSTNVYPVGTTGLTIDLNVTTQVDGGGGQPVIFETYEFSNYRPWAPTGFDYTHDSGDIVMSWNRRERLYAEWPDDGSEEILVNSDANAALGYDQQWEIFLTDTPVTDFTAPSTYLRRVTVTDVNSYTYSAAEQTEDGFDNSADNLYVFVRFIGGRTGKEIGTPGKFTVWPEQ